MIDLSYTVFAGIKAAVFLEEKISKSLGAVYAQQHYKVSGQNSTYSYIWDYNMTIPVNVQNYNGTGHF